MSNSVTVLKTKKAARDAGLRTHVEWLKSEHNHQGTYRWPMVPSRNAVPQIIKGEEFYTRDDCEELVSRTEARRRGLVVPEGTAPVTQLYTRQHNVSQQYDVFRISDCVVKRPRTSRPARTVDLLEAVFAVNRAAKRYRDAARKHYYGRRHGFAGHARLRKESLYHLKDRGILAAVRENRLTYAGSHGGLAVYRGEGYCFHSFLVPEGFATEPGSEHQELIYVESRPRTHREVRLCDAAFTLAGLDSSESGFVRLSSTRNRQPEE